MKNIKIIILTTIAFSLFSCDKILEINPRNSIDATHALQSKEGIQAATNSVYAHLRAESLYGRDLIAIPELLADNANSTGNGNRLVKEANNESRAHMTPWQEAYFAINEINLNLKALEKVQMPEKERLKLEGENKFLRALLYHNLLRVYAYDPTAIIPEVNKGGVPLMLTGVSSQDQIELKARASIQDGYDLLYEDLNDAFEALSRSGSTGFPHFASPAAVAALFSRVALYNGDYERVIQEAEKVFALSSAQLTTTPAEVIAGWRTEVHPESIFEIAFTTPDNLGSNSSLRATYMTRVTIDSQSPSTFGNVVFSEDLLTQFSPEDARTALIMQGLTPNNFEFEITKFASKNGVANLDNVPVIRFAEIVLNKAEAHAKLNQEALANQELNRIRTRVNLPAVTLSGEPLLEEILQQRRLEFAFEGHRFFDLKRLGKDINKESGTIAFTDFRILSNIPTRERDINKNLEQNEGY